LKSSENFYSCSNWKLSIKWQTLQNLKKYSYKLKLLRWYEGIVKFRLKTLAFDYWTAIQYSIFGKFCDSTTQISYFMTQRNSWCHKESKYYIKSKKNSRTKGYKSMAFRCYPCFCSLPKLNIHYWTNYGLKENSFNWN
jgi:hypothetical protein